LENKEVLGLIAVILSVVGFIPYIISIYKGTTKPHVFSWIVWFIATAIIFFAQVTANGGPGAWATGVSAVLVALITVLAYKRQADISITKSDWICFIIALLALPFWFFTSDPFWAVLILSAVDFLAFIPTVRKTYHDPYSEIRTLPAILALRDGFAMAAFETYNATTMMFPLMTFSMCTFFVVMITIRRKAVPQTV